MPLYVKLDIFRILERRGGAIYRTKKVGWHWFQAGQSPGLNSPVPSEIVTQNGLPPGEYTYCSTLDSIVDSRIPAGGLYR